MNVVIIGAGNVATVLSRLIKKNGHTILQVLSQHAASANLLAAELNCASENDLKAINTHADIYLIAVTDSSIKELSIKLKLNNKLVVHTAGSISKEILKPISTNYGVLYPLQSLRKERKEAGENIPLLIDAGTTESVNMLQNFATSIVTNVSFANDDQRLKLHIAAVLVSNFTNHLYTLAAEYCKGEAIDFNLLLPLIEETALRLRQHPPAEMMTGPAFRGDVKTIENHLAKLDSYTHIQNLYLKMTESILTS